MSLTLAHAKFVKAIAYAKVKTDAVEKRIERQLQPELIPHPDVQRLLWIPGIGKVVALTLYLEIDGIERFDSVRQFFSYCRVVPGAYNSGGKSRHVLRRHGLRLRPHGFPASLYL